jgi:hypothetical protein
MSIKSIRISPDLSLPRDLQTATTVVLGGKGMGKTNLGAVVVEELAKGHLRFSWIDPVGVSWGLRHGRDKNTPGLEILILGGVHGDIPIEPTGGAVVADLVVDEDVSVVIDVSRRPNGTMWSAGERVRFISEYCNRLFERQGERRRPILQVIDEAGRYVPQVIPAGAPDLAKCVGAIEQLVELGRNVGVGVLLITQRSAKINKSVSELADALFAFRTVGPNSLDAIVDWLGAHIARDKSRAMVEEVRSLPRGSALLVSPGWLSFEGVVRIRERETFDSSSTPKAGEARRSPGAAKKPDLGKYQERMAETIERAKANDPRELHKQIAELKRELAKKTPALPAKTSPNVDAKAVDRAVRAAVDDVSRAYDADFRRFEKSLTKIAQHAAAIADLSQVPAHDYTPSPRLEKAAHDRPAPVHSGLSVLDKAADRAVRQSTNVHIASHIKSDGTLNPTEEVLLATIAQFRSGASRRRIAVMSGRSIKSSSFQAALPSLEKKGLIEKRGDNYSATELGQSAAGAPPLPTDPRELVAYWLTKLNPSERRVLAAIAGAHPNRISREEVAEVTGLSLKSSSFQAVFPALRDLELIEGKSAFTLSDALAGI